MKRLFSTLLLVLMTLTVFAQTQGKDVFCGVRGDMLHRDGGFGQYNTAKAYDLKLLTDIKKTSDSEYYGVHAAQYIDGRFYCYTALDFTFLAGMKGFGYFDMESPYDWHKIADPKPLDKSTITYSGTTVSLGDYEHVYSMAYNYKEKKAYVLVYQINGDEFIYGTPRNCLLCEVNLEDGSYTQVASMPNFYYSICFDYSGQMYGLTYRLQDPTDLSSSVVGTNLNKLSLVEGASGKELQSETIAPLMTEAGDTVKLVYNYMVTEDMSFDYDRWMIRVCGCVGGQTYIMDVDPTNAHVSNRQLIGSNASVVGMYTPFTAAESPEAPAAVENLKAVPAANGEKKVTLTWKNPTKSWNKKDLTELKSIEIDRNGEYLTTLTEDVTLGGEMSFVDNNDDGYMQAGDNVYTVTASTKEEEANGKPASATAYVGVDVPGEVDSLKATTEDGKSVSLTWKAPKTGKKGGWYDETTLKYKVVRMPGNDVIAESTTETSLTDASMTTTASYTYKVTSLNGDGEGMTVESNSVVAGPALVPPYETNMETQEEADLWKPDMEGCWEYLNWGTMGYILRVQNTWLYSPALYLEKDKTYRVTYRMYKFKQTDEKVDLAFGAERDTKAMTDTIAKDVVISNPYNAQDYTYKVSPKETGTYYFGVYGKTQASNGGPVLAGFAIAEMATKDLGVDGMSGHTEVSAGSATDFTVEIENFGVDAENSYEVRLVDEDGVIYGSSKVTDEIETGGKTKVKVALTMPMTRVGAELDLYGKVIQTGDGNLTNNTSDPITVKVCDADGGKWIIYSPDELEETTGSSAPLDFKYKANCNEVVYNATYLGLEGDWTITKVAYDYTFGHAADAKFKTYMGLTTKTGFSSSDDLVAKSDLSLVAESNFEFDAENGEMIVHLASPFSLETGNNLVVATDREYTTYADNEIYDNFFKSKKTTGETYSTLKWGNDEASFVWGSSTLNVIDELPVTYFYVIPGKKTGVEEVSEGSRRFQEVSGCFMYNVAGQRVSVGYRGLMIKNGKKILK